MKELKQLLAEHHPSVSFDDDEIDLLAEVAEQVELSEGQVLFQETDPSDRVYLVVNGAVDLFARLKNDIEQSLLTVRPGGFVGVLALIDDEARDVNARAAETTEAYMFDGQKLNSLMTTHQSLGVKFLRLLADLLSKRLRIAIANLKQNLEWTLQVSGLASLDISQLIVDRVSIVIELVNGKQLTGTIMKAEEHPDGGFELFVATNDGTIHFIPYHAIVSASLPGDAIKIDSDKITSY